MRTREPTETLPARYAGPPTPGALAERLGVPLASLCKLDANESPYGPPPAALAALRALATSGTGLLGSGRYPDPTASALRSELATYTGVAGERIVVGNGSDELIHLLGELLLEPGDEVVVAEPTFSLYALTASRRGARVVDAGVANDFTVSAQRLIAAMTPHTQLIFLCAPNNPTGTPLARETLLAVLDRADALVEQTGRGPLVVVDEAYYEFGALSGDPHAWTAAPLVAQDRRLVVLRTFSKLFGLAGLRVGYALCPTEIAARLHERKLPYNVGVAGQAAALAALDDLPWLTDRAREIAGERERLAARLATFPSVRVSPSAANFVLVTLRPDGPRDVAERRDALWRGLLDRGILVRRLSGMQLAGSLRITIGTLEQNDRLLAALGELLPEGGAA